MFPVNFVTFAFCKLLFCHDSIENIVGIDILKLVLLEKKGKERVEKRREGKGRT